MSELFGETWITSRQKRTFDLATSSALMPLAIPASLVGAAAFYLETHVNPFFSQSRLGRHNTPMHVLKLRSMPFKQDFNDASNGHGDERASKVGRFLRKTALDEVPQIFNILVGQMSVVGPRPLIASDVEMTMELLNPSEQKDWIKSRSIAKPGWLSDFVNVSRSMIPQSKEYLLTRVELDCRYVLEASHQTDMKIIRNALSMGFAAIQ